MIYLECTKKAAYARKRAEQNLKKGKKKGKIFENVQIKLKNAQRSPSIQNK